MLTDAEMQKLLDEREACNFQAMPSTSNARIQYLHALDAALPKLVEEVRRLRKAMADRPFAKLPREFYHQDKGAFYP